MESKFDGGVLGMLGMSLLSALLCGITLGIATPWVICMYMKWFTGHTTISGKRLVFDGDGTALFGKYILWLLLTIITFGIYGLWVSVKLVKWVVAHTHTVEG